VLRARIEVEDQLMFINTRQIPAFDREAGAPTQILVSRVGERPLGGSTSTPIPNVSLTDTYWKLTEIDGQPAILGAGRRELHMVLNSEGAHVRGFSGCNRSIWPRVSAPRQGDETAMAIHRGVFELIFTALRPHRQRCRRSPSALPGAGFLGACLLFLLIGVLFTGCATVPKDYPRTPSTAFADPTATSLGQVFEATAASNFQGTTGQKFK
jgi:hypothetical protein